MSSHAWSTVQCSPALVAAMPEPEMFVRRGLKIQLQQLQVLAEGDVRWLGRSLEVRLRVETKKHAVRLGGAVRAYLNKKGVQGRILIRLWSPNKSLDLQEVEKALNDKEKYICLAEDRFFNSLMEKLM
jgi:hypothetical protein